MSIFLFFFSTGIARLNMGHFEDAIGYLEQQLATLEQLSSSNILIDKVFSEFCQITFPLSKISVNFDLFRLNFHRDEHSVTWVTATMPWETWKKRSNATNSI